MPTAAPDETRNCGEINRELLLRPEAGVVLGRAVRRPTARFVRFLQPEAADANRRTYRRASPRETKSGAPIVVANLVPTHDRGPGPPGGRSTWLLLSPTRRRAVRCRRGGQFSPSARRTGVRRLAFSGCSDRGAAFRIRVLEAAGRWLRYARPARATSLSLQRAENRHAGGLDRAERAI
jgi:hypothetical protein